MKNSRFNALIHAPNRLQICAIIAPMAEVEFKVLRDLLEVSDSVLSKHIKLLEDANYIALSKRAENGRQRTWIAFTSNGRKTYEGHIKELKKLVG